MAGGAPSAVVQVRAQNIGGLRCDLGSEKLRACQQQQEQNASFHGGRASVSFIGAISFRLEGNQRLAVRAEVLIFRSWSPGHGDIGSFAAGLEEQPDPF